MRRTPAPDPSTLNQPLEEGYIPCSPGNLDPFQCPRQILDPTRPGEVIPLPGQCVDLGQPADPAASPEPDGEFHCALLPGSPRPRTSAVMFSTLTGPFSGNGRYIHGRCKDPRKTGKVDIIIETNN